MGSFSPVPPVGGRRFGVVCPGSTIVLFVFGAYEMWCPLWKRIRTLTMCASSVRIHLRAPCAFFSRCTTCQVLSKQELGQCVRREEIVSGNVTGGTVNQSCQITYNPCSGDSLSFPQGIPAGCTGIEMTSHTNEMLRPYRSGLDGM